MSYLPLALPGVALFEIRPYTVGLWQDLRDSPPLASPPTSATPGASKPGALLIRGVWMYCRSSPTLKSLKLEGAIAAMKWWFSVDVAGGRRPTRNQVKI